MNTLPNLNFPGMQTPDVDYQRVLDGRATGPFIYEVDLSIERPERAGLNLNIAGNVLYIDPISDGGWGRVTFQDQSSLNSYITVHSGDLYRVPFRQIKISNKAQYGKKLRLVYGTDLSFNPAATPTVFTVQKQVTGGIVVGTNTGVLNSGKQAMLVEDGTIIGKYIRFSAVGTVKNPCMLGPYFYNTPAPGGVYNPDISFETNFMWNGTNYAFGLTGGFYYPTSINHQEFQGAAKDGGLAFIAVDGASTVGLVQSGYVLISVEP